MIKDMEPLMLPIPAKIGSLILYEVTSSSDDGRGPSTSEGWVTTEDVAKSFAASIGPGSQVKGAVKQVVILEGVAYLVGDRVFDHIPKVTLAKEERLKRLAEKAGVVK